jgi:hypothetical protein
MRNYLLLVLFLGLCFSKCVFAQFDEDPISKSYRFYTLAQWDSLYAQRAALLDSMHGSTSYFLHYRIGEAAWQKEDYRTAVLHFYKAHKLYTADTFALLFLQNSLLRAGLTDEAVMLSHTLKKHGSQNAYTKNTRFSHHVFTEGGLRFSNSDSVGNLQYSFASANVTLHPKWHLGVAYTYLKQDWYFGHVVQQNYLGRIRFLASPLLHAEVFASYLDLALRFNNSIQQFDQYAYAGGQLRFQQAAWNADIGFVVSNINLNTQHLLQLGFRWFPTTTRHWSLHLNPFIQQQQNNTGTALRTGISARLGKRFWLNADGLAGNLAYLIEDAGFLPNNSPDITRWRMRSTIGFYPHKKWEIYLTLSAEQRTESFRGFEYRLYGVFPGIKFHPFR